MPLVKHTKLKPSRVRVSEVFYSIEGEGPLSGLPTLFIRSFGCNFTCSGFSNPDSAQVTFDTDLAKFKPSLGCDSIYSWHPDFKFNATFHTAGTLLDTVLSKLPVSLKGGRHAQKPVLSLTGGEPMLYQHFWSEFLKLDCIPETFSKLIIETNSSVAAHPGFCAVLKELDRKGMLVFWACSPKLRNSGEPRERAIQPAVVASMQAATGSVQYFKFVSSGSLESFEEVCSVLAEYNLHLPYSIPGEAVYIMPEGALAGQQESVMRKVATMCLEYGFSFCARVHCWVYGNEIGT